MKIKQLLLSFLTLSVFVVSCSKEDIIGDIEPISKMEQATMSTSSTGGEQSPLRAYVFIEPSTKHVMIKNHLNTLPTLVPGKRQFLGFHGVNGDAWKFNLPNYINMPDIPQSSGGTDTFGNPLQAFNFKTIKISKNTVNDQFSWVVVLIPINAMNNDTRRQKQIEVVEKLGNTTRSRRVFLTENVVSNVVINYTGNRIPAGQYRVYSTYPSTGMRLNLNSTNDVYIRGFSN